MASISKENRLTYRKVFILRPDNLGDVVLFSSALRYIREYYPYAQIILCVKKSVKNLVECSPYIDKIIAWESLIDPLFYLSSSIFKQKIIWRVNHLARYVRCLFMKSDIVLLPVRSPDNGLRGMHHIVKLIPAREKIGISGDFCNQSPQEDMRADLYYTRRLKLMAYEKEIHEQVITCKFLKFLGIEIGPEDLWPEFWTENADRIWAECLIPFKKPGEKLLAIAPGVLSKTSKFYPGKKYAQVLSFLSDYVFHILIFGSHAEKAMCGEVESALKGLTNIKMITNLAGKTTIRQFIECMRKCDLLLSLETAALHIGVGLKKPTVGILGGGHYGRFYPWGNPEVNKVAHNPMSCYGCNWDCHYSSVRCIEEIKPETIAHAMRSILTIVNSDGEKNLKPFLIQPRTE